MNEVYVIAGGEWLRNNLNAIAAFMGTWTWDSIEKIALTLSVLAVAVMWVQRHNVMDLLGWVAVFVLISLLVNVRTSVQIIDNSDLVKVHRVDNVPVGRACNGGQLRDDLHATGQRHLQQNGDAVRGESDCEKHRFPVPESGNHQSVPGLRPELRAG